MERRLIALEEWMMHTDHLLGKLNDVLISVQDRLDQQDRRIELIEEMLRKQSEAVEEPRSLEENRPPHY